MNPQLFLCLAILGIAILAAALPQSIFASDEDESDIDDREQAIDQVIADKNDARLKAAEDLLLNGSCIPSDQFMELLTVPDPKAAEIAVNLETCK